MGTPGYQAPEILTDKKFSTASDIYALGMTIHDCGRKLSSDDKCLAAALTVMMCQNNPDKRPTAQNLLYLFDDSIELEQEVYDNLTYKTVDALFCGFDEETEKDKELVKKIKTRLRKLKRRDQENALNLKAHLTVLSSARQILSDSKHRRKQRRRKHSDWDWNYVTLADLFVEKMREPVSASD